MLAMSFTAFSQAPNLLNYQGVARNLKSLQGLSLAPDKRYMPKYNMNEAPNQFQPLLVLLNIMPPINKSANRNWGKPVFIFI